MQLTNTKDPLISVVIPTHNRAQMLKRAIKSILAQTYNNFEIIIVDDFSQDDTFSVVKNFNNKKIKYIKNKIPKGAAKSRNIGIRNSQGEFIAFLDDDDEWLPQKIEKQLKLFQNSKDKNLGMVYGWMEYFYNNKSLGILTPKLKGYIFPKTLSKQPIGGCPTFFLRKKIFKKINGFNESLKRGEDGDFVRNVCKYFNVDYVPEIVAKIHTGHQDRMSIITKKNCKNAIFELKFRLEKYNKDFDKYPDEKEEVLLKIAGHYFFLFKIKKSVKYFILFFQTKSNKNFFQKIKLIIKFINFHIFRIKIKSL